MRHWRAGISTSEIPTASAEAYINGSRPTPTARFNPANKAVCCCASADLTRRSLHHFIGPYSDEFDIGAEFRLAPRSVASIHLFRRDDKDRIAAIDTGVPAQAFTPVSILDPGPDGIPGTFDDQRLTVYAQNPATLGQDRYLLTNPAGLRMLNTGLVAEAGHGVETTDSARVLRGGEVVRAHQPRRCGL